MFYRLKACFLDKEGSAYYKKSFMFLEYTVLFFRRGMKVLLFLFFLKVSQAAGGDFQVRELYHSDHSIPLVDNAEDVIRWYPLAMKGLPLAQFNMGYMYEKGYGVPQNDRRAVKWYRLAANQGLDQAQFHLGRMYERGRGVRQNRRKAIRWYRKAANQGLIQAKERLYLVLSIEDNKVVESSKRRKCKSSFRKARKLRGQKEGSFFEMIE